MKLKILFIFLFLSIKICSGQQKVTWQDLSKVKFTEKYFSKYDTTFLHPEFSDSVKELEGKTITITGYFLDVAPRGDVYILSKGPLSACFFCGIGGPETAIELNFEKKPKYRTDTILTITGVLKLNDTDIDHFNYILTNCKAKVVK